MVHSGSPNFDRHSTCKQEGAEAKSHPEPGCLYVGYVIARARDKPVDYKRVHPVIASVCKFHATSHLLLLWHQVAAGPNNNNKAINKTLNINRQTIHSVAAGPRHGGGSSCGGRSRGEDLAERAEVCHGVQGGELSILLLP